MKSNFLFSALHLIFITGGVYLGIVASAPTALVFDKYFYLDAHELKKFGSTLEPFLQRGLYYKQNLERYFPHDLGTVTKNGDPLLYIPIDDLENSDILQSIHDYKLYAGDKMLSGAVAKAITAGRNSKFDAIIDLGIHGNEISKYGKSGLESPDMVMKMLLTKYEPYFGKLFILNATTELIQRFEWSLEHLLDSPFVNKTLAAAATRVFLLRGEDSWAPVLLQLIGEEGLPNDLKRRLKLQEKTGEVQVSEMTGIEGFWNRLVDYFQQAMEVFSIIFGLNTY